MNAAILPTFELDLPAMPASPSPLTDAERNAFLGEIPSETTPGERLLLFDFFSRQWDGAGKVVEIGPFLGGTTRAIAWGMTRNPLCAPDAALHTFDRFDEYYSAERLRETIEPLVRGGTFTKERADDLCRVADFERLFDAIHRPHDYARLIHLHNSPLPDLPAAVDGSASLDCLKTEGELGALFIDGCKSWASTHYAMKFLLPRTRPGAAVIFQDFGWYTCFWVSSVVHALRDFLELEAHIDATYVFRLKRPVTAEDVEQRFARSPAEMSETFFRKAHTALFERSQRRGDLRGELIAQLHHVAALITIGQRPAAAEILKKVNVKRYAADAGLIRGCLNSPTYHPGGKPIYWKEPSAP